MSGDDAGVTVALLGLGEVGRVFAEDLRTLGVTALRAWDTAFADPTSRASRNAVDLGLAPASSAAEAVSGATFVLSAVTAMNCVSAASSAAASIATGAWFFDLNSSSPGHKQEPAAAIEGAGGRYVEAALMSPIEPRRLTSPFLLGGPHTAEFHAAQAGSLGLDAARVGADVVGVAAAIGLRG